MNTLKTITLFAILTCATVGAQASTRPGMQGVAVDAITPQRCVIGHEAPHAAKSQQGATKKFRTRADAKNTRQSCLLFRKQLPAEDLKSEDTMADTSVHHPYAEKPL